MAKGNPIGKILYVVMFLLLLYFDFMIYQSGHPALGVVVLMVIGLAAFVYASKKTYSYRYLFPSLLGFGLFVILPLIYTIYIAFTNYGDANLQTLDKVQTYFMNQKEVDANQRYPFTVYQADDSYVIALRAEEQKDGKTEADFRPGLYVSEPFKVPLDSEVEKTLHLSEKEPAGEVLTMRQVIGIRTSLDMLYLTIPGVDATLEKDKFKAFVPKVALWSFVKEDGSFRNTITGMVIKPDLATGFYVDPEGNTIGPGFRVRIGLKNFTSIFTNDSIRGPFFKVFGWTLVFASLSVITTFVLGFLLAVLLEWKPLRFRNFWRSMIILPYAVPAFISILIFRGLFNPEFGEINAILGALTGGAFKPEWFSNPTSARAMCLLVNLWLGYPYMMILCTGILQSVPGDIYEASAIDGGTPTSDLFKMTLPLILPPLKPLLVASFAFNFNNFLLIQLLTGGAPQMVGASSNVGSTDILVTYTFNLAFSSSKQFGFASAIATIIFVIVSILAYVNLKTAMRGDEKDKR